MINNMSGLQAATMNPANLNNLTPAQQKAIHSKMMQLVAQQHAQQAQQQAQAQAAQQQASGGNNANGGANGNGQGMGFQQDANYVPSQAEISNMMFKSRLPGGFRTEYSVLDPNKP